MFCGGFPSCSKGVSGKVKDDQVCNLTTQPRMQHHLQTAISIAAQHLPCHSTGKSNMHRGFPKKGKGKQTEDP